MQLAMKGCNEGSKTWTDPGPRKRHALTFRRRLLAPAMAPSPALAFPRFRAAALADMLPTARDFRPYSLITWLLTPGSSGKTARSDRLPPPEVPPPKVAAICSHAPSR